jgi:hypothetical protein
MFGGARVWRWRGIKGIWLEEVGSHIGRPLQALQNQVLSSNYETLTLTFGGSIYDSSTTVSF